MVPTMSEPMEGTTPNAPRGAVVTGGARGIGRAIARRLGRDGTGIVILDRDGEKAEATAAELREEGIATVGLGGDVTLRADVHAAVERCVSEYGGIDIMVSNAGMADVTPLLDIEDDVWQRVLDVNLGGAFLCIQEAGRAMVADRGGSMVVIVSTNGFHPEQNLGAYNAAKGGAMNFVRSAGLDLARRGVRVNGIAPGFVRTPRAAWMTEHPELGPAYLATIPMGRWATPEDIADVAAFLVSDDARYMTGQTLVVDGGHTLGVPLPDLDVDLDRPSDPA
jgi:NAD(P)-dependent dehydrogenase (short-subunit alcohol dehydrogenase family)